MQHLTSRENDRVKYACHLAASVSFREKEGMFFAEGMRLCLDLAEKIRPKLVFCTERRLEEQPQLATLGEECVTINESVAQKLAETRTPQGVFCLFPQLKISEDMLLPKQGLVLCEQIQDPSNVGAMLRSAAAFGYGGVLLVGTADPFSPKALRAGMGAVLRVPVLCYATLEAALQAVQQHNPSLLATAVDGMSLAKTKPKENDAFVLMIGNEGAGLSRQALQLANKTVCLPMHAGVESLNAAVAASVLMFACKNAE